MPRTWLITGSSRDLARALAEAVLAPSDRLVFTARNPRPLAQRDAAEPQREGPQRLVAMTGAAAGE